MSKKKKSARTKWKLTGHAGKRIKTMKARIAELERLEKEDAKRRRGK